MGRRSVIAGVVLLVGVPMLVWWAVQTPDPRTTINGIGIVIAAGMAALVVISMVVDPKHFAQGGPHRLWFPTTIAAQALSALSALSSGFVSLSFALVLSMVAAIILWVRSRRHARQKVPDAAR